MLMSDHEVDLNRRALLEVREAAWEDVSRTSTAVLDTKPERVALDARLDDAEG